MAQRVGPVDTRDLCVDDDVPGAEECRFILLGWRSEAQAVFEPELATPRQAVEVKQASPIKLL